MPAAPATQPSPTSGTRRTSGRSPISDAIRASSDGYGEPGHGGGHDQVDVGGRQAGRLERVHDGLRAELHGVCDEQVVGLGRSRRGRRTPPAGAPGCAAGRRRWRGTGAADARRARRRRSPSANASVISSWAYRVLRQHPADREDLHGVRLLHRRASCGWRDRGRRRGPRRARGRRGVMRPSPRPISTRSSKTCWLRPAARIPASTTAGRPGRAARRPRCAAGDGRAGGARPRDGGARGGRRTRGQGPGGGAAGEHAGRDGVVDALAGHRVDQTGRVAGQQDRAVRLVPAPARQRQVVGRASRRPPSSAAREEPVELLRADRRVTACRRVRSSPTNSPYPTLDRPSPRSKAQAYDGWRRSPYRMTWRPRRASGVGA